MKIMIIKIIKVITVITFIVSLKPTHAQTRPAKPMIRVSPVILNISLIPGKIYTYQIEAENLLDIPLPLRASLDNFESQDEEGGFKLDSGQGPSPFLSWITIGQNEMIIPAKTKKLIALTIHIPNKVPVGGYYGVLFLEPVLPLTSGYANIVQSRIGVIMLANIGVQSGTGEKGEITNFSFAKNFVQKEPVQMNLRVKNISLNHFSAKPFIFVESFGQPTRRTEIEEKIILPGKIRKWNNLIALPSYSRGLYKITARVSTGNGQQIEKTTFVIAFPITRVVVTIFLFSLIFILIRKRKKLKKALIQLTK